MAEGKYSAKEVAEILQAEGCTDISQRTVNYYAFEKKLFDITGTGKNCFTDAEIDKIRGIRLLRECTKMTLEQIKEAIEKYPLDEIRNICINRTIDVSELYSSGRSVQYDSLPSYTAYSANSGGITSMSGQSGFTSSVSKSPLRSFESYSSPAPPVASGKSRTLKVNEDITLVIGDGMTMEKLTKLIEFIKNL